MQGLVLVLVMLMFCVWDNSYDGTWILGSSSKREADLLFFCSCETEKDTCLAIHFKRKYFASSYWDSLDYIATAGACIIFSFLKLRRALVT